MCNCVFYDSVDSLASIIHANQDNISWVDFHPISSLHDGLIIEVKIIPRMDSLACTDYEVQFYVGIELPARPIEEKSRSDLNQRLKNANDFYSVLLRFMICSRLC